MVFVKFHNMNRKKKFSNVTFKLPTQNFFHFTTSQNNITITVHKCSIFFSSFFQSMYCLFYKNVCSFFLFFQYAVFNNVQVLFFLCHFHCPVAFCVFVFVFIFFFFLFFFHNKLLSQCPFFFQTYIYPALSLP